MQSFLISDNKLYSTDDIFQFLLPWNTNLNIEDFNIDHVNKLTRFCSSICSNKLGKVIRKESERKFQKYCDTFSTSIGRTSLKSLANENTVPDKAMI